MRDAKDIRMIFCDSIHIECEDQSSSQGSGCLWGGSASVEVWEDAPNAVNILFLKLSGRYKVVFGELYTWDFYT